MILFCAALELWLDTPSATEAQLDDDLTSLRAEMQERVRRIDSGADRLYPIADFSACMAANYG